MDELANQDFQQLYSKQHLSF